MQGCVNVVLGGEEMNWNSARKRLHAFYNRKMGLIKLFEGITILAVLFYFLVYVPNAQAYACTTAFESICLSFDDIDDDEVILSYEFKDGLHVCYVAKWIQGVRVISLKEIYFDLNEVRRVEIGPNIQDFRGLK